MSRIIALSTAAAIALPATAAAAPKPPGQGVPTITAAPAIVVFGASTKLSGKVQGAKAGTTVALQRDPYPLGDGWLNYRTTTTTNGGAYSFTVPPFVATSYRAVAAGKASTPAQVRVRPVVGLAVVRTGSSYRFRGSVRPARKTTASIQRKTPSGAWTTVKRVTLTRVSSTRSTYSAGLHVSHSGTYRTKVGAGSGYLTGTSRERAVSAG